MDPDEALRLFRKCMARAREAAEGDSNDAEIQALQNAAGHAEDLDVWLSQGGFLPQAWGVARPGLSDVARRVLDACPVRTGVAPERLAAIAGCDVLEVLRVLPALELANLIEWTGTGWRLMPRTT